MFNEIKLIAFDLDGTFLDDEKNIPEKNIQALKAAAERGIVCLPATGRLATGIPKAVFSLPGVRYILASNGATVYDIETKQAVYRAELDPETGLRLCDYMDKLPVIYDCFQWERGYMSRDMYRRVPEFFVDMPVMMKYVLDLRRPVDDLRRTIRERWQPMQKMQMFYLPEDMELRRQQLELMPKAFPELKISSSVPNNIEINASGADKWQAISALCAHLGIDRSDTVCFGDASNDLSMLRGAGLSFAMRNGDTASKAAAGAITALSNNEGGVGETILSLI